MSTAAQISKEMKRTDPIQLNYDYVEYLSSWYLKHNPIDNLFVHLNSGEELHRKFVLNGIKFIGCEKGRAKANTYFPESKESCIKRVI